MARLLRLLTFSLVLLGPVAVFAQDALKSGPQPGTVIPGSFDPFVINGKWKGRYHCMVCEYRLNPAVLIFARESKEGALDELLQKLDETIEKNQGSWLGGLVVFLSPDAVSSPPEAKLDPTKLAEEAIAREALEKRLAARAEKLKHVVVGYYPAPGPGGYKLNDKAEVTAIFYENHVVRSNDTFAAGKLTSADTDRILGGVQNALKKGKKK